jgi:hypothetical protein
MNPVIRSVLTRVAWALPAVLPAAPAFEARTIDPAIEIGYGLAVADVDGDGRDDILLADKREIVWYANPSWTKHVIARNLTLRDNVCLAARDLDGDGRCEIAVGANWNPAETTDEEASGSVHYLVPGEDRTQPWGSVTLPHEPTVHRMHWRRDERGAWELVMQPLHGRGNVNGQGQPVRLIGYAWPADPTRAEHWKTRVLDESLHLSHNLDVDRSASGPEEVLLGGAEGLVRVPGPGRTPGGFVVRGAEVSGFAGAGEVRYGPKRLGRGTILPHFATIEPMHGNAVVVYSVAGETPDDHRPRWRRDVVDDTLVEGHALACGNLLGGSQEQIVAGWRKPDAQGKVGIRLYRRDDASGRWETHVVDDNGMAAEDLKLADLDGDGRLDIIAAGRATKNVKIYWNRSTPEPAPDLDARWHKHELWKGDSCPTAVAADADGDGRLDVFLSAGGKDWLLRAPDWTPVPIYAGEGRTRGCIHAEAMDVDGDGDPDFVGGARMVYWLENPGRDALASAPWRFRVVEDRISGVHCVLRADVNQDGKPDLITNEFQPEGDFADSLLWLETPAERDQPWARHVFAPGDAGGGNHYLGMADLDGDGDQDIACGAKGKPFRGGNWFAWWENTGDGPWAKHLLQDGRIGATCILPGDFDRDGRMDLVASCGHGTGVLWFRGEGSGTFSPRDIDPLLAGPHCLATGDLDGDGDLDAASVGKDDFRAVWYENDGKGNFTVRDIDADQAAYDLRALDFDGDGDLDLLVAGQASRNVVWYENRLNAAP